MKALEVIKSVQCVTEDCSWCGEVKLFSEPRSAVNECKVLWGSEAKRKKTGVSFGCQGAERDGLISLS